ncbi:MAG TPA: TetR/AcrR family transcriptional regulator [Acidimicrobiales bacterium]
MEAASRLISRDGLNGLTMVAVAKEAGVSRQLVYDHFPDLPTLFEAAFAEQARQYALGLDDVLSLGASDAPTMARQLFERVLTLGPDTRRVVRALIGGAVPVELARVREQFRATIGERWSQWFRALGLDDQSSNALVWVMTAAYLSLAELVDEGEIGADGASSIMAMLANGIVSQVPVWAGAAAT